MLSLAISEQYLVILTNKNLLVHSAFDTSVQILRHELDGLSGEVARVEVNRFTVMILHKNKPQVTSLIVKNKLIKSINTTELELCHCKEILRIFSNTVSAEILCVVEFYQIEGELRDNFSKDGPKNSNQTQMNYVIKPAYIDIALSYLSPSSKS